MKYLITEKQYRIIEESEKIEFLKSLIDVAYRSIVSDCESGADTHGDRMLSFDVCDDAEVIEQINVDSVEFSKTEKKSLTYRITIEYSSIKRFRDFDALAYELGWRISKNYLGYPTHVEVVDTINNLKNPQW